MGMSDLADFLEELYEVLFYGLGVAELGIVGVALLWGFIVAVVGAVVSFFISLLVFILEAIPLLKISKKMGRKTAWLVWLSWIPIIGGYMKTYVVADIPGDMPLQLAGKFKIQNRQVSFWIYIAILLVGPTLITTLISILSVIPLLGQVVGAISTLLYLVPAVAVVWIEYAYLRDILDIFKPDRKSNMITAIVIAILDSLITFGFARAVILYTVMNKTPLTRRKAPASAAPQPVINVSNPYWQQGSSL